MAFFNCVDMFSVVSFGIVKDWSALNLKDKKNWEENFSPSNVGPVAEGILISNRLSQERKDKVYLHLGSVLSSSLNTR